MLSKLLKYDLRANLRIFLIVWPAVLFTALIEYLVVLVEPEGDLGTLLIMASTTIFVLAMLAAALFSLIISVTRFYSGLLRDEGYLMFTLPVRPWQLVLSKFLTALLTILVTGGLCYGSVILVFSGIEGLLGNLRYIFSSIFFYSGIPQWLLWVLGLVSLCTSILQIYLACSIGHLFRKHRILWSVLAYYGINVLLEVVMSILMIVLVGPIARLEIPESTFLYVTLGLQAALAVGYFFLSEYILRTRLNLE